MKNTHKNFEKMTPYQKLIDEIKHHPAVMGVWGESQSDTYGVSLKTGYNHYGEKSITTYSPENILEVLKEVDSDKFHLKVKLINWLRENRKK